MNIFEAASQRFGADESIVASGALVVEHADPEIFSRLFHQCLQSLEDSYQEGTGAFIREHDPELYKRIGEAWGQIEAT